MLEGVVDLVGIEFVALSHALAEEVVSALFGENGHLVWRDGVDMIGKAELCLDYGLPFFALIDALTEDLRVLFEE